MRPMLRALATGNLKNIDSYADIMIVDVENFMSAEKRKINSNSKIEEFKRAKSRAHEENKANVREKAFVKLLESGFKGSEIEIYLDEVMKTGELDVGKIVRVTIELILGTTDKNNSNKNKRKIKKKLNKYDIRYIANKAKEDNVSIYEKLKESNYIRNFDDIMKGAT